jgi:hypothetical protein
LLIGKSFLTNQEPIFAPLEIILSPTRKHGLRPHILNIVPFVLIFLQILPESLSIRKIDILDPVILFYREFVLA